MRHSINLQLRDEIRCTLEEKKKCVPALALVNQAAKIARNHGLLELEPFANKLDHEYLKKAFLLIVDATDPEAVFEMLGNMMLGYDYSGWRLLEQLVLRDGVMSVACGSNPRLIQEKLCCWFGEDCDVIFDEINKHNGVTNETYNKPIQKYESPPNIESVPFEFMSIAYLEDYSIQAILKEVDSYDLITASVGASKAFVSSVIRNLSTNQAQDYEEKLALEKNVEVKDITCSRKIIEDICLRLADEGSIDLKYPLPDKD